MLCYPLIPKGFPDQKIQEIGSTNILSSSAFSNLVHIHSLFLLLATAGPKLNFPIVWYSCYITPICHRKKHLEVRNRKQTIKQKVATYDTTSKVGQFKSFRADACSMFDWCMCMQFVHFCVHAHMCTQTQTFRGTMKGLWIIHILTWLHFLLPNNIRVLPV